MGASLELKHAKDLNGSLTIEEISEDLLDVEGAAKLLNLHAVSIYKKVNKGLIPGSKKTGKWLFSRRQLIEWVEAD